MYNTVLTTPRLTTAYFSSPEFYAKFRNTRGNIAIEMTGMYINCFAEEREQIARINCIHVRFISRI